MRDPPPVWLASSLDAAIAPRPKKARGAYKAPSPEALANARGRLASAEAAVRIAITGVDLRELSASDGKAAMPLADSWLKIERALSLYVAVVVLGVPKRVLARAIGSSPKNLRAWCRTIEALREAPVIRDALERVEAALPR